MHDYYFREKFVFCVLLCVPMLPALVLNASMLSGVCLFVCNHLPFSVESAWWMLLNSRTVAWKASGSVHPMRFICNPATQWQSVTVWLLTVYWLTRRQSSTDHYTEELDGYGKSRISGLNECASRVHRQATLQWETSSSIDASGETYWSKLVTVTIIGEAFLLTRYTPVITEYVYSYSRG